MAPYVYIPAWTRARGKRSRPLLFCRYGLIFLPTVRFRALTVSWRCRERILSPSAKMRERTTIEARCEKMRSLLLFEEQSLFLGSWLASAEMKGNKGSRWRRYRTLRVPISRSNAGGWLAWGRETGRHCVTVHLWAWKTKSLFSRSGWWATYQPSKFQSREGIWRRNLLLNDWFHFKDWVV